MTPPAFAERFLPRLGPASLQVSDIQIRQLERYYELLRKWNRRVNLTSLDLDDYPAETLDRLLVEPLVASALLGDSGGTFALVDLGSGGGSPGIPMGIARPAMRLTLVESRERKSAFLREACREVSLPHADVLARRAEEIPRGYFGSADVVSARALRLDHGTLAVVRRLLKPHGRLLTFGLNVQPAGFAVLAERLVGNGTCVRTLSVGPQ